MPLTWTMERRKEIKFGFETMKLTEIVLQPKKVVQRPFERRYKKVRLCKYIGLIANTILKNRKMN